MHAGSAPAAVPRRLAVSPVVFRRVALAAVGVLILIVATGATVRLTGSGLGCPEWPTCTTKHALAAELPLGHRVLEPRRLGDHGVHRRSALAVAAWLTRGLSRRGQVARDRRSPGTIAQAPLGAITVYYDLNPYLVISHLAADAVRARARRARAARGGAARARAARPLPGARARGSAALLAGGLGSRRERHGCDRGRPVPRQQRDGCRAAARVLLSRRVLARSRRRRVRDRLPRARRLGMAAARAFPWLLRGCAGLLAILARARWGSARSQYRTYGTVPWWVVVVHVTLAAVLFAWTVGLVARSGARSGAD